MSVPLAVEIYRRFERGESAEAIAQDLGLPLDKVKRRIEVAAVFVASRDPARQSCTNP